MTGSLEAKILSTQELLTRHGRPREGRLVFTNGCFDLLHRGHVEYLEQAKSLGDLLVVGLNTDDSVRRLKGSGRPLVDEGDRARVLAALTSIDVVEDIVGREAVEAAGGTVTVMPFVGNYSTSALLKRLKEDM